MTDKKHFMRKSKRLLSGSGFANSGGDIMKNGENRKGFTVIELLIAITLLGLVIALTISAVNWKSSKAADIATKLGADFTSIEMAFSLYQNNTGSYPTGLSDTNFVPAYLFPPKGDSTVVDTTWQQNGYYLGQQTGQATPNNGYFVCTKLGVANSSDVRYIALATNMNGQSPSSKFYFNTSDCSSNGGAATTNMSAPSGATTIYAVYWLTRY